MLNKTGMTNPKSITGRMFTDRGRGEGLVLSDDASRSWGKYIEVRSAVVGTYFNCVICICVCQLLNKIEEQK